MKPLTVTAASVPSRAAGHTRLQGSILSAVEKRALVWMAKRMPAWINSDHLSALGLVSMAGTGASFWLAGTHPRAGLPLVVVCLFLNWLGDSLDGTLARVRDRQRPRYGFYLDHMIDIAGTAMMLAGLAGSGYMSPILAMATLAAWLLVAGESFLATHTRSVFRLSFLWLGPTELRIVIAAGALLLLGGGMVTVAGLGPVRLFDLAGAAATTGLALAFIVNAVRNTVALYRGGDELVTAPRPARIASTGWRKRSGRPGFSWRPVIFAAVGALGYAVQTAALWLLIGRADWPVVPATLLATEAAVLHNFAWHLRWTWADRPAGPRTIAGRLLRFHIANGGVSLAGGAALMALLVDAAGFHYLAANLVAVLACSIVNYLAGDRWVFRGPRSGEGAGAAQTTYRATAM